MAKSEDDVWEDLELLLVNTKTEYDIVKEFDSLCSEVKDDDVNMEVEILSNSSMFICFPEVNNESSYKIIYESFRADPLKKIFNDSNNYTNSNFCNCCRNLFILPYDDTNDFLNWHLNSTLKKHNKYLLLVFRLNPFIFPCDLTMNNKFLRNIIYSNLRIDDKFKNNLGERTELDIINDKNSFYTYINRMNREMSTFAYEIFFNQPNLNFCDYIQCSICTSYMCPMHFYLSSSYCAKCKFCIKIWVVCGWCKNIFNEEYACKYIHKK
jgi:hypothetical protein